jgi:hypothetical protein
MPFNGPINISEQDIRTVLNPTQPSGATGLTPSTRYGQVGTTWDGASYTYAQANGTTALIAGNTCQAAAVVANHVGRTNATAEAIGSTTVVVPLGATAATLGQYAEGYLTVVSGTGIGYNYRILTNTAATSSGSTTVTLYDPILVALDTTSVLDLVPHPNSAALITPTSSPKNVIGVSTTAVPVSNYFWAQTVGPCSVIQNGTIAANTGIVPGATTAGTVDTEAASTIIQRLGYTTRAGTSTQAQLVELTIGNQ